MNIEVIKNEKNEIEAALDNVTVAEVLRSYLYESGAEFAAWKRFQRSQKNII